MKRIAISKRLQKFPPYLFAEIDRKKADLRKRKIKFIDLSIGDPDILSPRGVIAALHRSSKIKENQKYALDKGKHALRAAIASWFKKRFGVSLTEENEILPLIGSKEGLVHLPLAFVDPSGLVIVPSPGYPGYRAGALLSGAKYHELALYEKNAFLPDLKAIPLRVRNKAKLIYLNYPNNPTTALAPKKFLQELVRFCARYGILIAYDNAYSEIYFDKKPYSILQVPGAKQVAIEFHSLSKTFCMTGFRIGWACADKRLIRSLLKVKTNIDSGIFSAIQDAGIWALEKEAVYAANVRKTIKARRDFFVEGLKARGFKDIYAQSTFYVWAKIPKKAPSIEYTKQLIQKGVVATPGIGFGRFGEGFIRFALTVDKKALAKALALFN